MVMTAHTTGQLTGKEKLGSHSWGSRGRRTKQDVGNQLDN